MLEDFFTLTEMKDGISTVARIGELVSEIQKLKNAFELNTADMIRQCSTVANTLASTKNEECLKHFVQLNGVSFLNHWLQDAQNCGKDLSNSAEDLIAAILTALECLPIDNEQLTSSGVISTVHYLLAHGNTKINQKASVLSQKWCSVPTKGQHVDTKEACESDTLKLPEASQEETDKQVATDEVRNSVEESKSELIACSDIPLPDTSLASDNIDATKQPPVATSPDLSNANATLGGAKSLVSSPASHAGLEKVSVAEETSASNNAGLATDGVLRSNSVSAKSVTGQDAPANMTAVAMSVEPKKPDNLFKCDKVDLEDSIVSTSSAIKEAQPSAADRLDLEKDTAETLHRLAAVSGALHDLSEESTGKEDGPTSSSSTDGVGICNGFMERCMNSFGDSSKATETKLTAAKGEKSKPLTDYDDTDALEVARLVAIEVEREVIDYRGPFCGSPDIKSRNAGGPDLEAQQQPEPIVGESIDNKSSSTGVESGSSSSLKEDGSGITDGSGPVSRKHTRNVELGGLDLNENQCAEETDCNPKSILSNSVNLSTPIAVAASRGSSVFPARLHFEGELGWKGSAATSAFRPASRRTPDGEKSLSASSHKTSNMLFDLNVADSDSVTSGEPLSTAILPASSGIASKDTSAAADVSRGLKLDLNCSYGDEEGVAITASNVPPFWNRQQLNGNWSQPSSSSSSKQPAIRNFDLNDNMSITDGSARGIDGSFVKASGRDMSDHSAVTIMGKRIVLGQREHDHQQQHNFLGPSAESRVPARSMQSYAHTPDYGVVSYPTQSAVPFPPAFYAPGVVPYMVDAKGAPVMPPMSGLGLGISHPSFSTRAIPPPSSELSYFHPGMDFNYGHSSEGGSRREAGNYWPVSFQGQNIFVDERTRNMSQGGSSGLVLKRKEPESGWDMYPRR
ncbi:hypothetical protein ACP70R_043766 [Stipagrostis hirtigluma subsp. patula]